MALAILSVAIAVLLSAGADAVRRLMRAEMLSAATIEAQSLLAETGIASPLSPGTSQTNLAGGRTALITVAPLDLVPASRLQALSVEVAVTDPRGAPLIRLSTVRVAAR